MSFQKKYPVLLLMLFMLFAREAYTASVSGKVTDEQSGESLFAVEVIVWGTDKSVRTNKNGKYLFEDLPSGDFSLVFFRMGYKKETREINIRENKDLVINISMQKLEYTFENVVITSKKEDEFDINGLRPVDGMAIYAGKKNELITMEEINANLATNKSRQIFAKVAGLNIWESDGAGLQLNIGGRGLNPQRTSNFNTRQNGYDISADALGYPESYYTPPSEAIKRIEVIRGAASLQYGTQFGGMLNFILKEGSRDKRIEVKSRQTYGSFNFFNSFNSVGGTVGKLNYYTYFQHKQGNGWRPNSEFSSNNAYGAVKYQLTNKLSFGAEYTWMQYLAHQPGGLTDRMFATDPRQSIRERNWFRVKWNLAAVTADYVFSPATQLNIRNFGLIAERDALGNLGLISRMDHMGDRDLIKGKFNNYGNETRLIHRYRLFNNQTSVLLVGNRYYKGTTQNMQGNASNGKDPDFRYLHPENLEHSDYLFPSNNFSVFAENYTRINSKLSVTPGIRFEYISTESNGYYKVKDKHPLTGELLNEQNIEDKKTTKRSLKLLGLGINYKFNRSLELYGNFSENYRAINFNDLRIVNPNFKVDPDITDERGYNADIGFRGNIKNIVNFDVSLFYLHYHDRIGILLKADTVLWNTYRFRTNISDSRNAGIESFIEADILKLILGDSLQTGLSVFSNFAFIDAKYINTDEPAIRNKKVEFVPRYTFKSGITFKRKKISATLQYAYTSDQFTDATNAEYTPNAVNGIIPAYSVMDFSLGYSWNRYKVETSINNLTNNIYFSQRAAGYPGPGIIPADPRTWYLTVQVKI